VCLGPGEEGQEWPRAVEPILRPLRHYLRMRTTYPIKALLVLVALTIATALAVSTAGAGSSGKSHMAEAPISGFAASPHANGAHNGSDASSAHTIGFLSVPPAGGPSISVWSWSGQKVADVEVRHAVQCCAGTPQLSPNGRFLLIPSAGGKSGIVTNLSGRVITRLRYADGIWASDSEHFCAFKPLSSNRGPMSQYANVDIESLDGEAKSVGRVQTLGLQYQTSLAECDVQKNQAVLFGNSMGETGSVAYLNLSTGATHVPKWSPTGAVALSGSDLYVAFDTGVIRNARTGAPVADVGVQVVAISWLGHVVVKRVGCRLEALDWTTNRILWMSAGPINPPCQMENVVAETQPHSDRLALNVGNGLDNDSTCSGMSPATNSWAVPVFTDGSVQMGWKSAVGFARIERVVATRHTPSVP
jgi:hypothetical protein